MTRLKSSPLKCIEGAAADWYCHAGRAQRRMLNLMIMLISWEARGVGWDAMLQAGRSVRGASGVEVEAGGLQGCAAALGQWEALVIPVQTQILHRHQLAIKPGPMKCLEGFPWVLCRETLDIDTALSRVLVNSNMDNAVVVTALLQNGLMDG